MRIGINLLFLLPGIVGGTETYAVSLISALSQIDHQNDYLVFLNRESSRLQLPVRQNFKALVCPVLAKFRLARYLWEQVMLPFQVRKYRLDLLHSPGYVQPLHVSCPSVVTIHDLNFHNLAPYFSPVKRATLRYFVSSSAKKAHHILTGSEFSKSQIVELLRVPKDKVTVTYYAAKKRPLRVSSLSDLSERFGIQRPYVLALTSFSGHKNISALVRAFQCVKKVRFPELRLVLAGHSPGDTRYIESFLNTKELHNNVVFTGYVDESLLAALYTHAEIFVIPSLYEGFGLPILEAFVYGTPVASSDVAALTEVAGDAACYFNPRDVKEIAGVMTYLLQNETLRETLVARGKERVKSFDWERNAQRTVEVYERFGARRVRSHQQEEQVH